MIAAVVAFADAAVFIGAVNPADEHHERATRLLERYPRIVTTQWVLAEVLAYFSGRPSRQHAVTLIDRLTPEFGCSVLPATDAPTADLHFEQAGYKALLRG
jgi:predicted nucleic acid-binding protein